MKTTDSKATFKGCDLLIAALEHENVDTVFAYPGGTSMEMHQAIARRHSIRVILPRHEQGGAFAADGYARATGRVGVCMATSGPGATNLVTGIANAYMDSIPIVSITGQVNHNLIGRNAFQETDFFGVTLPICKYSYLVTDVNEIPRIVHEAFYIASSGRPGPVVIDVPKDIQQAPAKMPAKWDMGVPKLRGYHPYRTPQAEEIESLLFKIRQSKQPLIHFGGGVISSNASVELQEFIRRTKIPAAGTLMGVGAVPEDDPFCLKWLGMHGAAYSNWASRETDLLLGFGCRFDDRVTGNIKKFAPRAQIVHVDIDPSEINKNKHADFAVVGDIKTVLQEINRLLKAEPLADDYSEWREKIAAWREKAPLRYRATERVSSSVHIQKLHKGNMAQIIMPQEVIRMLSTMTSPDTIITTGVGQHQMWTAQFYTFKEPRTLITSGGLGSMGYGFPAAIGAKVAFPNRQVIDIDGDGSFQMNIQELATVRAENIPVKVIILNNQYLGMVCQLENAFYAGVHANTFMGDPSGRNVIYPDIPQIAKGYDVKCERIVFHEDLQSALQRMLDAKEPYILDIITPDTEQVLPFIKAAGTVDDMVY